MKNNKDDNRVSQFMPFNALNNLLKKIKEAEEEHENNFEIYLAPEAEEKINNTLKSLKKDLVVYLEYVLNKRKYSVKAKIDYINKDLKYLKIDFKKIEFKNIIKIEIL